VAWKAEVWLFFKVGRWDFFDFSRNYISDGVGWGGWKKEVYIYIYII
jgi:hypothetical protein